MKFYIYHIKLKRKKKKEIETRNTFSNKHFIYIYIYIYIKEARLAIEVVIVQHTSSSNRSFARKIEWLTRMTAEHHLKHIILIMVSSALKTLVPICYK